MSERYCLQPQEQIVANDLAISIYQAKQLCPLAAEPLYKNKKIANAILDYWKFCNSKETNYAINKLLAFFSVRHLQTCWVLKCYNHPEMED